MGAEKVAAIERVAAPAEVRQDEVVQDGATPEEARVLALQRSAGNRAVTALLRGDVGPAVQRAISLTPSQLDGSRTLKERVRTTFAGADTYGKISNALADFHRAGSDGDKLELADTLIGLTDHWLAKHGSDPKHGKRRFGVTDLGRQARSEARELRRKRSAPADQGYLGKMESGGFKGVDQSRTKSNVLDPAEDLAAGRALPGAQGADERAAKLVAKYRLTAAEVAAIRLFTLPDYQYINPAAAGSGEWLASNVLGSKDPQLKKLGPRIEAGNKRGAALGWARGLKPLMEEGAVHVGKLTQALAKLPAWDGGVAYRGERISKAKFDKKYAEGGELPFGSFASAAKARKVAQEFADGKGDIRPLPDQKVSVVAVVYVKTARDISRLSAAFKPEEEVVILPGTKFTVERVIPMPRPSDPGSPPASWWYTVHLREAS